MTTSQGIQGFAVSPQQRRLWALAHDSGREHGARCRVRIEGRLDVHRLRAALMKTVARHESLRTTFFASAEMSIPLQVVADSTDASGPLRELQLIEQAPDVHLLSLAIPALCSDAIGLQILVRGVAAAYADAEPAGGIEPLQYVDASVWLNEMLTADEARDGRRFWDGQPLKAMIGRTLPFRRRDGAQERFAANAVDVPVPGETLARMCALGEQRGLSVDGMLMAAWEGVLRRAAGESTVGIGYLWHGRAHDELHDAIGPFARLLPLQGASDEDLSFADFARSFDAALDTATHWGDSFDCTLTVLRSSPLDSIPFFPFIYEPRAQPAACLAGGVTFAIEECSVDGEPFDLKLVSVVGPDGTRALLLEHDERAYTHDDAARLAGQLAVLIAAAAEQPDSPVHDLPVASSAQQREIVAALNAASRTGASADVIHRLFETAASRFPDRTAVVDEGQSLTYGRLNARSNQLAWHLRRRGVGPDVPVGVCLERSVDAVVALLAVFKAGGACVPLEPAWPPPRTAAILHDAAVATIVTVSSWRDLAPDPAGVVLVDAEADEIAAESVENLPDGASAGHLAYVLFTSGSTGRPKGVAVEHQQLASYVESIRERLDVPDDASYATVTTMTADLGNTAIYPALTSGGCLHILSETRASDPEAFADYISRFRIDVLKIVPSHLQALLTVSNPRRVLPHQRLVLGGEACSWSLVDTVRRLAPACAIVNHYGPTEATVGATTYRVDGDADRLSSTVPIGRPLAHARTYVLDRQRRQVPVWSTGELCIGGAGVARGYVNAPELTAERFAPDPFADDEHARMYRTGDCVRVLPSGQLEFLGRGDDQLKIRGYRVEPGEIAAALERHPSVSAAVVLVVDAGSGEKRLVGVVTAADARRPAVDELRAFVEHQLPEHMVPGAFAVVDAIPRTANGKVDRQALAALVETAQTGDDGGRAAPSTPWEDLIADVWRGLLHLEEISVVDNFYDLGGHSLMAIQVVTAIEKRTGLQVSPRELVFNTLRQFAATCESRKILPPASTV